MKKIYFNNLKNYLEKEITVSGFVEKIRDTRYVVFVVLRDGFGRIQLTLEKENDNNKEMIEKILQLPLESTIEVIGVLKENPNVKMGGIELLPKSIIITSVSDSNLPISINNKDKALRETRLDYRFIDLRRDDNNLLFKCETILEHGFREYFINNDYTEIHSPKISAKAAESGSEVFKLDYFGNQACLSQSPQFYKQMALAAGFDKVFEIGPAFRAENSHTSYHATEINMLDVELAWIASFEDVMDEEEKLIKYAFEKLEKKYSEKIKEVFKIDFPLYKNDFPRITFEEAKKILKEKYNYEAENKIDMERHEEELLWQYAKEKYNSDFIFVTKYPFATRSFYHMVESNVSLSYDLIYRGVEITTGAQREHRTNILIDQMKQKQIKPEELNFYIDFFKYGCPPHGGFAIGIARVMMKTFEIDNIREATFIYRGPTRLNP